LYFPLLVESYRIFSRSFRCCLHRYGILRDLHEAGIRGGLPDFISKFLNERGFRVRVGSCLSDLFDQEMGVPQGAILSVTLFILK